MSTFDETDQAILDKINDLLGAIDAKPRSAKANAALALAANHLAETRAWLHSPGQAHGGTANPGESGKS